MLCLPVYDTTNRLLTLVTGDHRPALRASLVLVGRTVVSLLLLVVSVALLVGATNNAFIYTRF